jgi:spore coat polysaccharide biosynthesis predicted glycosyltransferase SpsG
LTQFLPDTEIFKSPDDMASLMFTADICICGSGTTILELATIATPAVIIPQSDEELKFSSLFAEAGFAVAAGTPDGLDSEALEIALLELLNTPETIPGRGSKGRQLCDGLGADRIVDEIMALL